MKTSILILCYGDYYALAQRCIRSLGKLGSHGDVEVIIGLNAVCLETKVLALSTGAKVIDSAENLNKSPMMSKMLEAASGELVWWLDDDSYIVDGSALERRLMAVKRAPENQILWGHVFYYHGTREWDYGEDVKGFVERASWYKGHPVPSGVTRIGDHGSGPCDRWFFATGGCWMAETAALRMLEWPDPRLIKRNDDVFLCEAIRQQGWSFADIGPAGCIINDAPRRGTGEDAATMRKQVHGTP